MTILYSIGFANGPGKHLARGVGSGQVRVAKESNAKYVPQHYQMRSCGLSEKALPAKRIGQECKHLARQGGLGRCALRRNVRTG